MKGTLALLPRARTLLRRSPLWPGESLSSLLVRLTYLNYYAGSHLLARVCQDLEGATLWRENLSCPNHSATFVQLAQLTQVPVEELLAASRYGLMRRLVVPPAEAGRLEEMEGLPPPRKYVVLRTDQAAQYCPVCLEKRAYHRLVWVPWAATVCLEHGCLLVDRCPHCQKRLSVEEVVLRQCGECRADLCTAPLTRLKEEEEELFSQQVIQSWLLGTSSGAILAQRGLPLAPANVLYAVLESLCQHLLTGRFLAFPAQRSEWSSQQGYALYQAGVASMMDWPDGWFQFLDEYLGERTLPPYRERLQAVYRDWFRPGWRGSAYDFVKQAYVAYLVSRGIRIPVSFAYRYQQTDWFEKGSGIGRKNVPPRH